MRRDYIQTYQEIAVLEMHRSGIPASITLAQGILESQWGQGSLAANSQNHFGIKCKAEWTGKRYAHKDDDLDADGRLIESCFRVYDFPEDSYIDHSNFLIGRSRYESLFRLARTDYRGWAKGLSECGYATDKNYAAKLIRIIEENGLAALDQLPPATAHVSATPYVSTSMVRPAAPALPPVRTDSVPVEPMTAPVITVPIIHQPAQFETAGTRRQPTAVKPATVPPPPYVAEPAAAQLPAAPRPAALPAPATEITNTTPSTGGKAQRRLRPQMRRR